MNHKTITVVTGNPNKFREIETILSEIGGNFSFQMRDVDLPEIQTLNLLHVVEDKIKKAYRELKTPVIVEDVSAGLDELNGLPGTFIKFFNNVLGGDALYQLSHRSPGRALIRCVAAYYDGQNMLIGNGGVRGSSAPRE